MRVGMWLRFPWVVGLMVPIACCGTTTTLPGDASLDVSPKACTTSSDCPTGYTCFFRPTDGCNAKGQCFAGKAVNCSQYSWCSCSWAITPMCSSTGGLVTLPVFYGVCPSECLGKAAIACAACDTSGYPVTTMSKPVATPGACSGAQITSWITACHNSSIPTTCRAWHAAQPQAGMGSGCSACLRATPDSAATWGAIHCADATHCSNNIPGCVDLVTNGINQERQAGGSGSCGDLISALEGCENYMCGACPSNDGTGGGFTGSSEALCEQSVLANECKSYDTPIESATGPCALINGDAAPPKVSRCFPQSDADLPDFFDVFCGTGP